MEDRIERFRKRLRTKVFLRCLDAFVAVLVVDEDVFAVVGLRLFLVALVFVSVLLQEILIASLFSSFSFSFSRDCHC